MKYIIFGKYPQSVVTDCEIIEKLEKITKENERGYLELEGNEYKKISSKPWSKVYTFKNGFNINSGYTYYFKVEPIVWKVLNNSNTNDTYFLLSEEILEYCCFNSSSESWLMSNYDYSYIRLLLNGRNKTTNNSDECYEKSIATIAFNEEEKQMIEGELGILNGDQATSFCFDKTDKECKARNAVVSDYARCIGCYMYKGSDDQFYGDWWLSTPSRFYNEFVKVVCNNNGGEGSIWYEKTKNKSGLRISCEIKNDANIKVYNSLEEIYATLNKDEKKEKENQVLYVKKENMISEEEREKFNKIVSCREESFKTFQKRSMRGAITNITDKYTEKAHFVVELIQNANDSKATCAKFKLYKDKVVFIHNGEKHFTISNVDDEDEDSENGRLGDINSITSIGNSSKTEETNKIGKFGIGFKSVFYYTKSPYIYEKKFSFCIENFFVPKLIDEDYADRKPEETVFVLNFDSEVITQEDAFKDIKEKLNSLNLPTLFLDNLQEIKWEIYENDSVYYGSYEKQMNILYTKNGISLNKVKYVSRKIGSIETLVFLLFTQEDEKPTYSICYKYDEEKNELISCNYPIFCYFPTNEYSKLPFIIHAPFLLSNSREGIKRNEKHNEQLIEKLANLASQSIIILRDLSENENKNYLNNSIVNIIPKEENAFEKIHTVNNLSFYEFYKSIKNVFLKERVIVTDSGFKNKENVCLACKEDLENLFSNKLLGEICQNKELCWAFPKGNCYYGISNEYFKTIIKEIKPKDILSKINFDFISARDIKWLTDLFAYIKNENAYKDLMKEKPIFLNMLGEPVAAYKGEEKILFLDDGNKDNEYRYLSKKLFENEDCKSLIQYYKIRKISYYEEFLEDVLPKYQNEDINIFTNEEHIENLKHIFQLYLKEDENNKKKIINKTSELKIFICKNNTNGEYTNKKASEIYIDDVKYSNLRKYFSKIENQYFLKTSDYYDDNPDFLDFLIKCGIKISPINTNDHMINYFMENAKNVEENNDISFAKFLWEYLIELSDANIYGEKNLKTNIGYFQEHLKTLGKIKWFINYKNELVTSNQKLSELDEMYHSKSTRWLIELFNIIQNDDKETLRDSQFCNKVRDLNMSLEQALEILKNHSMIQDINLKTKIETNMKPFDENGDYNNRLINISSLPLYSYKRFTNLLESIVDKPESNKEYRYLFTNLEKDLKHNLLIIKKYTYSDINYLEDSPNLMLEIRTDFEDKKYDIDSLSIDDNTIKIKLSSIEDFNNINVSIIQNIYIIAGTPKFIFEKLYNNYRELSFEEDYNLKESLSENIEFVFGPPGTGKTYYIANNILNKLLEHESANILCLGPTNKSVDVLMSKIYDNTKDSSFLSRLGTSSEELLYKNGLVKDKDHIIYSQNKKVVGTTTARYIYDYVYVNGEKTNIKDINWDYVIIDEASMISLPQIMYILYKSKPIKFYIAGDPKQIKPVDSETKTNGLEYQELKENIYDVVELSSFSNPTTVPHNYNVICLTKQYRSIPKVANIYNNVFYDGLLEHNKSDCDGIVKFKETLNFDNLNIIEYQTTFLEGINKIDYIDKSPYHIYSALFAYELSKFLAYNIVNINSKIKIGIISPYKTQSSIINKMINNIDIPDNIEISAGTIHKFQGEECDIIILVVNTSSEGYSKNANDNNILNVAISRAKEYLFILAPDECDDLNNLKKVIKNIAVNSKKAYNSYDVETLMFDDSDYIKNNTEFMKHQKINVYTNNTSKYIIRTNEKDDNKTIDIIFNKK